MTLSASAHSGPASAPACGDPRPVAMSYAGPAGYRPPLVPVRSLLPTVTSLKTLPYALPAARYRAGLAKPIGEPWHPLDAFTSATSPAHSGAAALVPPTACHPDGAPITVPDPF